MSPLPDSDAAPIHGFLAGGGATAAEILERDWSATPLGPIHEWPESLRNSLALVLACPQGMFLAWGGRLLAVFNDACRAALVDRARGVPGQPLDAVWGGAWREFEPLVARTLAGRAGVYRTRAPDGAAPGDSRWRVACSPLRDDTGTIRGVLCVTAQEAAPDLDPPPDLERRERDRAWDLGNDLMGVCDGDGRLVLVNPAWTRSLHWSEQELLRTPLRTLVHPDDVAALDRELAQLRGTRRTLHLENRLRTRHGAFRRVAWALVPDEARIHAVGRDVTDQHALATQLHHAQKMEAVGQLTGGIAHDFNNLLTGIVGALDLMRRRLGPEHGEQFGRYLGLADASARRAASVVRRLLAFSRRQALDRQRIDVDELVADMGDLLRRTLGEQIRLKIRRGDGLWPACSDRSQLENALLNLVINARDAMPVGGTLGIATANRHLQAPLPPECSDLEPGDYVELSVTDTGSGMSQAVAERAFDPFFTTKALGDGTGLGLSMVHGYAHQAGGDVRIDSQPGRGTRVTLLLPRMRVSADPQQPVPVPAGEDRSAGEPVLVVEDRDDVRQLLAEVLVELGYAVHQAGDAADAMRQLDSDAAIDLLVTDIGLPGTNGRQLAELARLCRPGLPVLFVTGHADHRDAGDGAEPDTLLLGKPFAVPALAAAVRRLLPRR